MRITIFDQHLEFFKNQGSILFENVLNEDELSSFNEVVDCHKFPFRDVWRSSLEIKTMIKQKRIADIASKLVKIKPLRMGYDQYFPQVNENNIDIYQNIFFGTTIKEICSIQGVVCATFLCLSEVEKEEGVDYFFPTHPGDVLFINPDQEIDFKEMSKNIGGSYYMIVFTNMQSVFIKNEFDPGAKDFAKLGYNYGDRLNDIINPIIYR